MKTKKLVSKTKRSRFYNKCFLTRTSLKAETPTPTASINSNDEATVVEKDTQSVTNGESSEPTVTAESSQTSRWTDSETCGKGTALGDDLAPEGRQKNIDESTHKNVQLTDSSDWVHEYDSFCADIFLKDPTVNREFRNKLMLAKTLKVELSRNKQRNIEYGAELERLRYEQQELEFQLQTQENKNNLLAEENAECMVRVTENRCLEETIQRLKNQLATFAEQINKSRDERRQIRAECVRIEIERQRLVDECLRLESNKSNNLNRLEALNKRREELELCQEDMVHRQQWAHRWQEVTGAIRVFVRIRSYKGFGRSKTNYFKKNVPSNGGCLIVPTEEKVGILSIKDCTSSDVVRMLQFNQVFASDASQCRIYQGVSDQVRRVLDGFNVTMIFHGTQGSGKTYTMCGTPNDPGVAPYAVAELLRITKEKGMDNLSLYASAIEIYNEHVTCVLSKCAVRVKDTGSAVHIENQLEQPIKRLGDFNILLSHVNEQRKSFTLDRSHSSSRSHLILILKVIRNEDTQHCNHIGTLMLVDLASPIRLNNLVDKTEKHRILKQENWYIQKSIILLCNVLRHLRRQDAITTCRGSRLTELLKPCFSGDSYLTLFLTVIDDLDQLQATQNVLELGEYAMGTVLGVPNNHYDSA